MKFPRFSVGLGRVAERLVGTDADASRKFRYYWFVIRGGSGAIRRSWLAAIRRRLVAERPPVSFFFGE